jgi:hypothetical protein
MAVQETIQDRAAAINASWHKTTDGVLETARLCAEADHKLRAAEKSKFFEQLDFNKATFSKLSKIGSQHHLEEDDIRHYLPPNYTVVYEIAKLSEKDLKLAIKDGVITPYMTRAELEAWVAEKRGDSKEDDKSDRVIATLKVPTNFDHERESELQLALDEALDE